MVHKSERVVRGCITSKHIVQLFDSSDTLANGVSAFLTDNFQPNDKQLVVARPKHWKSISDQLQLRGCSVQDATRSGRLTVCDAFRTLTRFMRNGQPVAELFQTAVGNLVAQLTPSGGGTLWIYGEMVDILAEERNFPAARYLEELWNDLGLRQSFTLLCGYSSAHFADSSTAHMLSQICDRHTHVEVGADDVMGSWVLKKRADGGYGSHELPPAGARADA